jgi:hypothetical protein
MGQPLTLDEVGVSEQDAAQVIYDLRRQNAQLAVLAEAARTFAELVTMTDWVVDNA